MIRILCALPFAFLAGAMVAGCADDSFSSRERPAPGYDNVNMGSSQRANSIVPTNLRRLHNVILIAGASLDTINRTPLTTGGEVLNRQDP